MTSDSKHVDLDEMLSDTWQLVASLHHGASALGNNELWAYCAQQVQRSREHLAGAGLSVQSVDLICYAQCALLDECLLNRSAGSAHARWASDSLQASFFRRHQAGVQVYDDMRRALADPACDPAVLMCFHRLLMLGFLGNQRDTRAPERQLLLQALSERVPPFALRYRLPRRWWRVRGVYMTVGVLVLVGMWWVLAW